MAQRKASTTASATVTAIGRASSAGIYGQLLKRLKALGCVFCPGCYAYMYPDHVHGARNEQEAA